MGAYAFDHTRLEARIGYVYDQAAPIGEIILGAPTQNSIRARFHGRAAHAGMVPEDGRSAIFAAARAVADMRLGRIDHQSSANVGVITGGTARNIVPEWCTIDAEARSRDPETLATLIQEMLDAIGFAASTSDCTAETEIEETYRGYTFTEGEPAVALAAEGLRRAGYEPTTAFSGGGADANVFNERGLACVNLGNGMEDIHTPDERIAVVDLEGMVEVTLSIIAAAREARDVALTLRWGTVTTVTQRLDELIRCTVDGNECIAYPRQTGPVEVGDTVLVNTQATDLGLGSGGFHVLYANMTRGLGLKPPPGAHVMALPYTPGQSAAACVEELDELAEDLGGMPVVCCGLHSQVPPVFAGIGIRRSRGLRAAGRRGAPRGLVGRAPDAQDPAAPRGGNRCRAVPRRGRTGRDRRVGADLGKGPRIRCCRLRDRPRNRWDGIRLRAWWNGGLRGRERDCGAWR